MLGSPSNILLNWSSKYFPCDVNKSSGYHEIYIDWMKWMSAEQYEQFFNVFYLGLSVAFFRVIAGNCLGRDLILVPPHTPFQPSKHGWFSQVLACGASSGMCNHFRHAPLTLLLCRLYVLVHMNRLRTTNRIFFVCFQTASCYCCYFVALRCFEDQEFDSLFMLV